MYKTNSLLYNTKSDMKGIGKIAKVDRSAKKNRGTHLVILGPPNNHFGFCTGERVPPVPLGWYLTLYLPPMQLTFVIEIIDFLIAENFFRILGPE